MINHQVQAENGEQENDQGADGNDNDVQHSLTNFYQRQNIDNEGRLSRLS